MAALPNQIYHGGQKRPLLSTPRHSYLYLFIHGLFWKSLITRKYGRNKPGIFRLFMIHVVGTVPWNTFLAEKTAPWEKKHEETKLNAITPRGDRQGRSRCMVQVGQNSHQRWICMNFLFAVGCQNATNKFRIDKHRENMRQNTRNKQHMDAKCKHTKTKPG